MNNAVVVITLRLVTVATVQKKVTIQSFNLNSRHSVVDKWIWRFFTKNVVSEILNSCHVFLLLFCSFQPFDYRAKF